MYLEIIYARMVTSLHSPICLRSLPSEKESVSHQSVSGFPKSPVDLWEGLVTSVEVWESSREVWGTFGEPLIFFQGCENGVFGKRCFCPLPKTGGFDEKWRKGRFTFYPQKQGVALLRARKPTKMTKMAGVPQTKPGFAKNRVFATLILKIRSNFLGSRRGTSGKVQGKSGKSRKFPEALGKSDFLPARRLNCLQLPS